MAITILISLAVLSGLVIAHELGHFIAAKTSGVRVEEFGLGFPPRLLSFKRGETRYSLNAIPFGGFNKLTGEEDPKETRSLAGKSIGTRLWVLSAGSLVNLILPILLFSIAFMIPRNITTGQIMIEEVASGSPAAAAGIQAGDILLSINGEPVQNIGALPRYIQLNMGTEVTILVQHPDSTTESVQLTPRWRPPEGQGAIGITYRILEPTIVRQSYPFWKAIPLGAKGCIEAFILYKNVIISMIMGTVPIVVAGPVGIVEITGEAIKAGASPLMELAAFISLNLGIINILPLPALDGGRITFVLLEWVRRGKRISPKKEGLVHLAGFVLLIGLLLVLTYQDIMRIVSGGSLIP